MDQHDKSRRALDPLGIALGALVLSIIGLIIWISKTERDRIELRAQSELDGIARQIQLVQTGKQNSIHFYCTNNTDALLRRLIAEPLVTGVVLELTDVNDASMDRVAAITNLKSLTIYGGMPGIGNAGFARLKPLVNLEELSLVTDQGLPILEGFPKLQSLILYREAFREKTLSDAGLKHLVPLTNLRHLELSGGWATPKAIEELRESLPECEIVTTSRY